MIKLRKWLSVVYLISVMVLLGGLFCYWFELEPVKSFMTDYRSDVWLHYIAWTLLGIVVIGTFGYVIRTLSQRGKNTFQKHSNELGAVQISRSAIVHEVNGVVDAHSEVKRLKTSVVVKNRREPYANVTVRVSPRGSLEMPVVAALLQQEIKDAVIRLTGNDVRNVTIDVRRGKKSEEATDKEAEPERVEDANAQALEISTDVADDSNTIEEVDMKGPENEAADAGESTTAVEPEAETEHEPEAEAEEETNKPGDDMPRE